MIFNNVNLTYYWLDKHKCQNWPHWRPKWYRKLNHQKWNRRWFVNGCDSTQKWPRRGWQRLCRSTWFGLEIHPGWPCIEAYLKSISICIKWSEWYAAFLRNWEFWEGGDAPDQIYLCDPSLLLDWITISDQVYNGANCWFFAIYDAIKWGNYGFSKCKKDGWFEFPAKSKLVIRCFYNLKMVRKSKIKINFGIWKWKR